MNRASSTLFRAGTPPRTGIALPPACAARARRGACTGVALLNATDDPVGALGGGLWTVPAWALVTFSGLLISGAVVFLLRQWRGRR
jgi:hypothetical protein